MFIWVYSLFTQWIYKQNDTILSTTIHKNPHDLVINVDDQNFLPVFYFYDKEYKSLKYDDDMKKHISIKLLYDEVNF